MNRIKDYSKLAADISNWIKQYALDNNIKSLVVGVSGGVDSAVVSTLCAITGLETHLLYIPMNGTDEFPSAVENHLVKLTEIHSGVYARLLNLEHVWDEFAEVTRFSFEDEHGFANSRARLRMTILYQVSAAKQGIVVGTGNKVEDFGIGFYTKYGDGGVDISPIADLYKSEVKQLAMHLGISQEIIDAKPTDGLWSDNRTDEEQLSCTYEELEEVMEYIETGSNFELTKRQQIVMSIYTTRNSQNRHKMTPIPVYKL